MSFRSRFRTVVLLAVLEFGALSGMPMPPEKVRALMEAINTQKRAHVLPSEQADGQFTVKRWHAYVRVPLSS